MRRRRKIYQEEEEEGVFKDNAVNWAFVVYWYSFSNSCTVVRSLGLCLV